jgi:exopolysaccharide biosynthesis polyprenyl glycosylphosphotransferase
MIEQRTKGMFWGFAALLALGNAGIFILLTLLDQRYGLFGLNLGPRTFLYVGAIPVALYYSLPFLRRAFQRMEAPSLWVSLTTSIRISLLLGAAMLVVYFFLKDVQVSRLFLVTFLGSSFLFTWMQLYAGPGIISYLLFDRDASLRAIVYCHGSMPDSLRKYIRRASAMGIDFVGYYADQPLRLKGIEWLGNTREVLSCEGGRKRVRADIAFAYAESPEVTGFRENIDRCLRRGARVHIYSNFSNAFLDPVRIVSDGPVQFLSFLDEPLQNPLNVLSKRAADIAVSLPVVLFVLPPLTAAVWLLHRLQSPGPVFFKQTRYGANRRAFTILKYRSMHVHDKKDEKIQATKGDPRVFGFGKFLRKSSLDEFPQFLNVLRGEMSVVGPRPHLTLHDDQFESYYRRYRSRHFVKPGITGLAQVSGYRGEAKSEEDIINRVRYDIQYVTSWSITTDIYIFLKTAWQVLFPPKSAY